MAKRDLRMSLKAAAESRKVEQVKTEEKIKAGEPDKALRGRPVKYDSSDPKVTVTFSMKKSRKEKLKRYAFEHGITISDLIGEFVDGLK